MNMNSYRNDRIFKILHASCTSCHIGRTCATLSQKVPRHRVAEGASADTNNQYSERSLQSLNLSNFTHQKTEKYFSRKAYI